MTPALSTAPLPKWFMRERLEIVYQGQRRTTSVHITRAESVLPE